MEKECRNCMWLYHMVTYNPTAPCSECLDHDKWQTTKRTNYDRIVSKTPEELAEFIANAVDCCNCKHPRNGCSENDETCAACWLDWLKQEASE